MPYVVTTACIDVKDGACQVSCPVDCIYEGGAMMYIQPEECINCGLCVSVCPVKAIFAEVDLPDDLSHLVRRENPFPPLVNTLALGHRDAFTLALADERPLELGKRTHDVEQQLGHGRGLGREREALLDELHADALPGQHPHQGPQILKIARQAIHRMDHHRVALPHIGDHLRELRPIGIFAGGVVGKGAVDVNADELPIGLLVECAHPYVTDNLSRHLSCFHSVAWILRGDDSRVKKIRNRTHVTQVLS